MSSTYFWIQLEKKQERETLAHDTAHAFFQQLVHTRLWNANHGGVYVPVTDTLKPNPYLTDDPLRDLSTMQGLRLTKINPAYMTRLIAEIAAVSDGVKFHITSLNPIRPENRAMEWEAEWLRSFEDGKLEQGAFFNTEKGHEFRYMAPLFVKDACMKCHAKQGYKSGDVRGGISVTLPYIAPSGLANLSASYSIVLLSGILLIGLGGGIIDKKHTRLIQTNKKLNYEIEERKKVEAEKSLIIEDLTLAVEKIKALSGIVPICMYCKQIRDDKGYWNQLEAFISEHSKAEFSHSICPSCMEIHYPDIAGEAQEKD